MEEIPVKKNKVVFHSPRLDAKEDHIWSELDRPVVTWLSPQKRRYA